MTLTLSFDRTAGFSHILIQQGILNWGQGAHVNSIWCSVFIYNKGRYLDLTLREGTVRETDGPAEKTWRLPQPALLRPVNIEDKVQRK